MFGIRAANWSKRLFTHFQHPKGHSKLRDSVDLFHGKRRPTPNFTVSRHLRLVGCALAQAKYMACMAAKGLQTGAAVYLGPT